MFFLSRPRSSSEAFPRRLTRFDDVLAPFAQVGRVVLQTSDRVTPRLDAVRDMEKPPLVLGLMGFSYRAFNAVGKRQFLVNTNNDL
jgi:hypothetical protein